MLALPLLEQNTSALALQPPQMQRHSFLADRISGKRYLMDDNEDHVQAVSFSFEKDACIFTLWGQRGEHRIHCGAEQWHEQDTTVRGNSLLVAASGTWSNEHTYIMTWRFVETPYYDTVTCYFEGDKLR
jgi:hypothetical protein